MIQDVNSAFSCTVMFVSISEVIGCEDRLRNDLYCVEWGVKLYSNQSNQIGIFARSVRVKLLLSWCTVEVTYNPALSRRRLAYAVTLPGPIY